MGWPRAWVRASATWLRGVVGGAGELEEAVAVPGLEEGFGGDAADVVGGDKGVGVIEGLVEGEVVAGGAGGGDGVEDVLHERAGAEEGRGDAGGGELFFKDVGGGDEAEV